MRELTPAEFFQWAESHPQDVRIVWHPSRANWVPTYEKMVDHLLAGVRVVIIFDPDTKSTVVYRDDVRPEIFERNAIMTLADVLLWCEVPVARFFE